MGRNCFQFLGQLFFASKLIRTKLAFSVAPFRKSLIKQVTMMGKRWRIGECCTAPGSKGRLATGAGRPQCLRVTCDPRKRRGASVCGSCSRISVHSELRTAGDEGAQCGDVAGCGRRGAQSGAVAWHTYAAPPVICYARPTARQDTPAVATMQFSKLFTS